MEKRDPESRITMTGALDMVRTRCALCGDARSRPVVLVKDPTGHAPGEYQVVRCVSCGSWRLDPAPAPEMIHRLYPGDYGAHIPRQKGREEGSEEGFRPVIPGFTHRLRRRFVEWVSQGRKSLWTMPVPRAPGVLAARIFSWTRPGRFNPLAFHGEGRRVLDVGCAAGELMDLFLGHGWTPVGMELSREAAAEARLRGHRVIPGRFPEDAERLERWSPYSAVIMSNVLEHLPHPDKALVEARRLLEPGGFLLIWTPVTDGVLQRYCTRTWYNLDPPRHLHLFSRKGLASLVRQSGFHILSSAPGTSTRAALRTLAREARVRGRPGLAGYLEKNRATRVLATPLVWLADLVAAGDVQIVLAQKNRPSE